MNADLIYGMPHRICSMFLFLTLGVFLNAFPLNLYARNRKKIPDYLYTSPFPWRAYQNSAHWYRCAGYAKSTDITTAHDKALAEARKRFTDALLNAFNDNDGKASKDLAEIPLGKPLIVSEKIAPAAAHTNMCWIIIKIRKKTIRAAVQSNFLKIGDPDLRVREFMAKFDDEMAQLKNTEY